jgi:hypothetical protein
LLLQANPGAATTMIANVSGTYFTGVQVG